MESFLEKVSRRLISSRLLRPAVVFSDRCSKLGQELAASLAEAEVVRSKDVNLSGRDVVLCHSGEDGWEEALELVCRQSPGRLIVVSPELPRIEALKLQWVADISIVERETYRYEVHELGLSA